MSRKNHYIATLLRRTYDSNFIYPSYLMLGIIGFVMKSRPMITDNVIVPLTDLLNTLMDYLEGNKVQT